MRGLWFSLVCPFVCIGLVGGLFAADVMGAVIANAALVTTPVLTGLLGLALSRGRRIWVRLAFFLPVIIVGAGVVNALGLMVRIEGWSSLRDLFGGSHGDMFRMGALLGGLFGTPFIPPLLWVFVTAMRVGKARAGSMLDGAHRRAPWIAVAASCAIGACLIERAFCKSRAVPYPCALPFWLSLPALLALSAFDVGALLKTVARARLAPVPVAPGVPAHDGEIVDLGVGDERSTEALTTSVAAYRAEPHRVVRLRGSVGAALRSLRWSVAIDVLAIAVVAEELVRQ